VLSEEFNGAVFGAVVDDDSFNLLVSLPSDRVEAVGKKSFAVPVWNYYADELVGGHFDLGFSSVPLLVTFLSVFSNPRLLPVIVR
jgi:hypothetical protein